MNIDKLHIEEINGVADFRELMITPTIDNIFRITLNEHIHACRNYDLINDVHQGMSYAEAGRKYDLSADRCRDITERMLRAARHPSYWKPEESTTIRECDRKLKIRA